MRTGEDQPLERVPDPTALTGAELGKSRKTRQRILIAACDTLAEKGYRRFSTLAVAQRAGMTRAAMLYHFGSRLELVTASIHFLARRRIEIFEEAMAGIRLEPGYKGQAIRAAMVDTLWQQLQGPEFAAFSELTMAARTEPELEAVLRPAIAAFDESRRDAAQRTLPPGSYDIDDFQLARDVVRFLTEGIMQQDSIAYDRERRLGALRHFLKMLVASTPGNAFLGEVVESWRQAEGLSRNVSE